jgi:hypothetical protein
MITHGNQLCHFNTKPLFSLRRLVGLKVSGESQKEIDSILICGLKRFK